MPSFYISETAKIVILLKMKTLSNLKSLQKDWKQTDEKILAYTDMFPFSATLVDIFLSCK